METVTAINPAPTVQARPRKLPAWAIIAITLAGMIALAVTVIALVAMSTIFFGATAAAADRDERAAARAFNTADPDGGSACVYLDMAIGGVAPFDMAREHAAAALTTSISSAVTDRQLYDACVAAGANMSPWNTVNQKGASIRD